MNIIKRGFFKNIVEELHKIKEKDPSAKSIFEVFCLYPGVHAVLIHRFAYHFYKLKMTVLAEIIAKVARLLTGIDIHPSARIGSGVLIDHGMGVVIGENVVIGDGCIIYQGVSLMADKKLPADCLVLGKNVLVGSGAVVVGAYEIGDNCKIASNAVVLDAIPKDSTVAGVPAIVVKQNGIRIKVLPQPLH